MVLQPTEHFWSKTTLQNSPEQLSKTGTCLKSYKTTENKDKLAPYSLYRHYYDAPLTKPRQGAC